ncbi:MAG: hypothetical protein QXH60_02465 [Candidatus Pacearchaeota archaeon]
MERNNKRGQFYLIAAIIIIIVLISISLVTNYTLTKKSAGQIKIYQLSQELQLEGEQVVNFGLFNEEETPEGALEEFIRKYGEYIQNRENNIYFIYGDKTRINVFAYTKENIGSIGLDFGGEPSRISIEGSSVSRDEINFQRERNIETEGGEIRDPNIIVEIGEYKYPFKLKEGQNFFFVIQESNENG